VLWRDHFNQFIDKLLNLFQSAVRFFASTLLLTKPSEFLYRVDGTPAGIRYPLLKPVPAQTTTITAKLCLGATRHEALTTKQALGNEPIKV